MAIRIKYLSGPGELLDEDAHTLRVLQQQTFERIYTRMEHMHDSYWWLAYSGSVPIGLCSMTPGEDAAILNMAGVLEGFRGLGLQRKMIRKREKFAKELGFSRLVTYVAYNNVVSANNLIKCGFLLYEPEECWGLEGAYYLAKKLRST